MMGRRRRRVVRIPRKRLPKIFLCPNCSLEAVKVTMMRDRQKAEVKCGNCGLHADFPLSRAEEPVDIYCKFTDKFYTGALA